MMLFRCATVSLIAFSCYFIPFDLRTAALNPFVAAEKNNHEVFFGNFYSSKVLLQIIGSYIVLAGVSSFLCHSEDKLLPCNKSMISLVFFFFNICFLNPYFGIWHSLGTHIISSLPHCDILVHDCA